jgi:hypothetical protein
MFNAKVSAVKNLMVVGKLCILISISTCHPVQAQDFTNPKFFEYSSNHPASRVLEWSFGWYKKLNDNQKNAYMASVIHALHYAENGEQVTWYRDNASGVSTPVLTWPTGSGYCRRLHLSAIAYNKQKVMTVTACHYNSTNSWAWYSGK